MKRSLIKIGLVALLAGATLSMAQSASADPADARVLTHNIDIAVAPNQVATYEVEFSDENRKLQATNFCNSWDAPNKHVEVKAFIKDAEGTRFWFDATKDECSFNNLPDVSVPAGSKLIFKCKNFDAGNRFCRVKSTFYVKN